MEASRIILPPGVSRENATAHAGASYTSKDMAGWIPRRLSADAEILPELSTLVGRSGDLERNSGVAQGGIQTMVDNIVGTGLRLSARPYYRALGKSKSWADGWSREVESQFHAWWWSTDCHAGDSLTGDQLTAQALRSALSRGEALALPLWLPGRGGSATKIQPVEADRLSQPNGQPSTIGFRGGIEFDRYGAPVAYHIAKNHPGDVFLDGGIGLGRWERIPRRTSWGRLRVLHVFDAQRPGQSRGKPLLAAVLPQFKTLERYTQAELQAALVNALIAMTIKTPMDQESILELFNRDHDKYLQAREEHAVRLSSGMVLPLFPGDEAQSFIPSRPVTAFDAFVSNIYRLIGTALDMPRELLLKDFSQTNYSSARAALLEAWRSFARRRDWLGTTWMDPIYGLWFEEKATAGEIDAPDFYRLRWAYLRARWMGPGRGWVDPVKEATAANLRIDAYISTLEDECAEQGKDWRDVLEQVAIEQAEKERLGLKATSAAPQIPTAPTADSSDPSGDEDPLDPQRR